MPFLQFIGYIIHYAKAIVSDVTDTWTPLMKQEDFLSEIINSIYEEKKISPFMANNTRHFPKFKTLMDNLISKSRVLQHLFAILLPEHATAESSICIPTGYSNET